MKLNKPLDDVEYSLLIWITKPGWTMAEPGANVRRRLCRRGCIEFDKNAKVWRITPFGQQELDHAMLNRTENNETK